MSKKSKIIAKKGGERLLYPKIDSSNEIEANNDNKNKGGALPISLGKLAKLIEEFMTPFAEKIFRRTSVRLMKIENKLVGMASNLRQRNLRKKNQEASILDKFIQNEENKEDVKEVSELTEVKKKRIRKVSKRGASNSSPIALEELREQDEKFDEDYWINLLKHDSTNAYPYKKLGEIYAAREDFKEARAVLKYALKLDRGDEESMVLLESLKGKRTKPVLRKSTSNTGKRNTKSA